MPCMECGIAIGRSKRGHAKRFCSTKCKSAFNHLRAKRGSEAYDLLRVMRRERSTAQQMDVWTELCRLETLWEDEDRASGRVTKSYKSAAMALSDLQERDRVPTTNIYVKEVKK